ncbi:hypothetical protein ABZ835_47200 [Streptomyces sp. NPDC047461]|uniref:hypothetical protein n=1 Tax=Streptomyces sp. NPDC047461 TaxID=3155619 RepID=UPI0033D41ACC
MTAQDAAEAPVSFARLTDAYWLNDTGEDCARCGSLFSPVPAAPDGEGHGTSERGLVHWIDRIRLVMMPMAVLVVACALAVAMG